MKTSNFEEKGAKKFVAGLPPRTPVRTHTPVSRYSSPPPEGPHDSFFTLGAKYCPALAVMPGMILPECACVSMNNFSSLDFSVFPVSRLSRLARDLMDRSMTGGTGGGAAERTLSGFIGFWPACTTRSSLRVLACECPRLALLPLLTLGSNPS